MRLCLFSSSYPKLGDTENTTRRYMHAANSIDIVTLGFFEGTLIPMRPFALSWFSENKYTESREKK